MSALQLPAGMRLSAAASASCWWRARHAQASAFALGYSSGFVAIL
jgi:hypothetical protein